MIFTVQAAPGPRAGAAFVESQEGRPLLLLDLDPVRVWVAVPPATEGPRVMAEFLREVAREAARMAERVAEFVPPLPVAPLERDTGGLVAGTRSRHAFRPGDQPAEGVS